jgi:hypothetical protein
LGENSKILYPAGKLLTLKEKNMIKIATTAGSDASGGAV